MLQAADFDKPTDNQRFEKPRNRFFSADDFETLECALVDSGNLEKRPDRIKSNFSTNVTDRKKIITEETIEESPMNMPHYKVFTNSSKNEE